MAEDRIVDIHDEDHLEDEALDRLGRGKLDRQFGCGCGGICT